MTPTDTTTVDLRADAVRDAADALWRAVHYALVAELDAEMDAISARFDDATKALDQYATERLSADCAAARKQFQRRVDMAENAHTIIRDAARQMQLA